jgi:hypothetical protein
MKKEQSREAAAKGSPHPVTRAGHFPPRVGFYPPGTGSYPPVNLPPVKPYPPDPYMDQFSLPEALVTGTLFRWLYDPYENPYRE